MKKKESEKGKLEETKETNIYYENKIKNRKLKKIFCRQKVIKYDDSSNLVC